MEQLVGTAEWLKALLVHFSAERSFYLNLEGKHWFTVTDEEDELGTKMCAFPFALSLHLFIYLF